MGQVTRRGLLRAGAGIAAGTALAGGPLQGFVALAAGAPRTRPDRRALGPVPDLRDGQVRLHLPVGFQYRSFHDTEATIMLDDGTTLPGRHDGMAAFQTRRGNVVLVRNHEVNGPVTAAFGPGVPYDNKTGGGTTTIEVTRFGEVVRAFTSLNGTQMNCSGGRMPWGSWITCEETVNGPDVGPDFTNASNVTLEQPHGYLFEVPASTDSTAGQSNRQPIKSAGRFAHEAVAYDPHGNHLYLTEDNFGFPSGLYRYIPPSDPRRTGVLEDGGTLQMLAVDGVTNANLAASQPAGAEYPVRWVVIEEPDRQFPYTPGVVAPTTNNEAIRYVSLQGLAQGAARFSRLEGCVYDHGVVYFCSTQGGGPPEPADSDPVGGWGNGTGQIWAYDTRREVLRLVYESPGADTLDFPDNVTTRNGGTLVLCEDNVNDNYLRGLTPRGELSDIALNRVVSALTGQPRFNDEFAGATFSPDGHTLFVNIQATRGMSFAIWGPWGRIGVH
jgi:secreted PhoX family phosphatase